MHQAFPDATGSEDMGPAVSASRYGPTKLDSRVENS